MIKLYLADIDYNIIMPINLSNSSVISIKLEYGINKARQVDFEFTTYLDELYEIMLQSEVRLILELDDYKIGLFRDNNLVTHLLPFSEVGSGSDLKSAIFFNDSYSVSSSNLTMSSEFSFDVDQNQAFYLKNNLLEVKKKYYRIKAFTNSNNNSDDLDISKNKLYEDSEYYIKNLAGLASIDRQIKYSNGTIKATFFSSTLELNSSKRKIELNKAYAGNISNIINQLDQNYEFDVIDDVIININTGMYSNFELLNEIANNSKVSWREIGLFNTSQGVKTKIQIANFDKMAPKYFASNFSIDNISNDNRLYINGVTQYFPALSVDLNIKKFILEGEQIQIDFKKFIETGKKKVEIFNITKKQTLNNATLELINYI